MLDRLSDAAAGLARGMTSALQAHLARLLDQWLPAQRLYTLQGEGGLGELMVESFTLDEALNRPFHLELTTLAMNASVDLHALIGQRVSLLTTLADGSRTPRSAVVMRARQGAADGGFARYHLSAQPWVALLGHTRHSRVWQDKSVIEILDDVFGDAVYSSHAAWQWGETGEDGNTEDLAAFIAQGPNGGVRSYCVQYRESDLAFAQRLLAEEGLNWRIEEHAESPSGHRVVVFADSARVPQNATSTSPLGGKGIRFHAAGAVQKQDAIQAFGGQRELNPAASTLLHWDYRNQQAASAQVPTNHRFAGSSLQDMANWLEDYAPGADGADTGECSSSQAQHRATCRQQAYEARNKTWLARSTVRNLRAGEWFTLTDSPLDSLQALFDNDPARREFAVLNVQALGINNLPKDLSDTIAQSLGPDEEDPFEPDAAESLHHALAHDPRLREVARATGYANRFEAIRRSIPWRPEPLQQPTALGLQTAVVIGPYGNDSPQGAEELYTDALGRIKLRFHWQAAPYADARADNQGCCWVRVAQRWAGPGQGTQFIPRIGQEVLVQFIDGDASRPIVIGALYNGRGEAGIAPTPGGQPGESDLSPYAQSNDHRPSAQGNLMGAGAGGHSPAWHGGAPGTASEGANAQNNSAALSGFKSKEFGGEGFNQLVFDDTPGQLRVQLATTQHASQLNLGYLIHQADNHRGSFRGEGFELRTDAYGAIRAAQGLLITTYGTGEADPAGDNAPGMALLKQSLQLTDSFSGAAKTHQTTQLATAIGSIKANQSPLSDKAAPMKALHTTASGMVSQQAFEAAQTDAAKTSTQADQDKLPHTADPIVAFSAKAGFATVAGQDIQWASGDTISVNAGQDIHIASGGQMRVHTGQSIGILAGAVQPGEGAKGKGLTLIAGQGPVQMQAQAGQAQVAAKGLVNIQTANAHMDWAAAKKITLATSGGATVELSGSGIEVKCPGKITVKAAKKVFAGPSTISREMNGWEKTTFDDAYVIRNPSTGEPLGNRTVEIERGDGSRIRVKTDAAGKTPVQKSQFIESIKIRVLD
jgi:Rhs element Vgr protein